MPLMMSLFQRLYVKKFVNNVMVLLECAFEPLTFVIIFLKMTILKLFMFQTFLTFDTFTSDTIIFMNYVN